MSIQEAYGFSCLLVGALLIVGQVWVVLRGQTAAAKADEATESAKVAVQRASLQLTHVSSLTRDIDTSQISNLDASALGSLRNEIATAQEQTAAADAALEKAKETAEDWRSTLVTNLSSRVPLATAGIVLIILGAVINGYLDVAAGNDPVS